ncbi:GLUG domain protein [Limihaloglobus sulfuriphilus]|uniref:GLUG domain protein n=1 Tax=Limihaloglobus sulfuriphilus TaxID=1851148 RepID=A0A1Q2MBW5_9BACT|nr:dockerin type I repeat-containing protein [Limihaloglobus sulfuriphilus]AQQ70164.1 GLUG domain protein [Limihaloglobus sulfuriphilus]
MSNRTAFSTLCIALALIFAFSSNLLAFAGGDGTPENPWQVSTVQDILDVNNDLNACYTLTNNIDFNDAVYEDYVIGAFYGSFDGNGFTVMNLALQSSAYNSGFFRYIYPEGTVKNLFICNFHVTGHIYAGVLTAWNGGLIENCHSVSADIKGLYSAAALAGRNGGILRDSSADGDLYAAGGLREFGSSTGAADSGMLVGVNNGTIENCNSSGLIHPYPDDPSPTHIPLGFGGLVGFNDGGIIQNCYSTASLTDVSGGGLVGCNSDNHLGIRGHGIILDSYASGNLDRSGGGIAGNNSGYISGCYSVCTITGSGGGVVSYNNGYVTQCYSGVNTLESGGGFVSLNGTDGVITDCYSLTNVTGAGGGFARENGGLILGCLARGDVTSSEDYVGGFVGRNRYGETIYGGTIIDCFATGNVTGNEYVGGFAGENYSGRIENCFSAGMVTGSGRVGGLIGYITGGIQRNCFWDKDTAQQPVGYNHDMVGSTLIDNVAGKTTEQMKNEEIFLEAGWDLNGEDANGIQDTWYCSEGQYPLLTRLRPDHAPLELQGCGTGESPYMISSGRELLSISRDIFAHYELTGNIYLANTEFVYSPFPYFYGSLNGQGHFIENLHISAEDFAYIGLFGRIMPLVSIRNLGLKNATVSGLDVVGILAGDIILDRDTTGVGNDKPVLINNCFSTGSVTGSQSVGGLIGLVNNSACNIINCYSTASVVGDSSAGGLIAGNAGIVSNCYASGNVNATDYAGGFVSQNFYGSIENCYAAGDVHSLQYSGGFVSVNDSDAIVSNSYATGIVTAESYAGGFAGRDRSSELIMNCFWDIDASGMEASEAGTGKTTAQMQDINTFLNAGWDYVNESENGNMEIWYQTLGGYPVLYWQAAAGDINCDGVVDLADFTRMVDYWLLANDDMAEGYRLLGDINHDGSVDLADFAAALWQL